MFVGPPDDLAAHGLLDKNAPRVIMQDKRTEEAVSNDYPFLEPKESHHIGKCWFVLH